MASSSGESGLWEEARLLLELDELHHEPLPPLKRRKVQIEELIQMTRTTMDWRVSPLGVLF
jgi:hypothetical protein